MHQGLFRKFCWLLHCDTGLCDQVFTLLTSVALAFEIEDHCIIAQPVQSRKQSVVITEEIALLRWLHVTCKDHGLRAFLRIPPVDHIEKHPSVLLVEYTPPDFVDDKAGRLY